jgi:hypothetical protein
MKKSKDFHLSERTVVFLVRPAAHGRIGTSPLLRTGTDHQTAESLPTLRGALDLNRDIGVIIIDDVNHAA